MDDSIVRGTTTPRIVALLREAGAREVHLRITSPPIKHPCYLGVDMATYGELIAANFTVEEIRAKTGRGFFGLSEPSRIDRFGRTTRSEMCLGCFVGEYPNVPAAMRPGLSSVGTIRQDQWFKGRGAAVLQSR